MPLRSALHGAPELALGGVPGQLEWEASDIPVMLADKEPAVLCTEHPALPGCHPSGVSSAGQEGAPKLVNTFPARLSWLPEQALLLPWVGRG